MNYGLDAYACCSFLALCARLAFCCARRLLCVIADLLLGRAALEGRASRRRIQLPASARQPRPRSTPSRRTRPTGRARTAAWAAVLGAWVVALEVYRAVRARPRLPRRAAGWLLRGGPDWPRAASYTVSLQHLPPALRDEAALKAHLETLFPGEVAAVRLVVPEDERRGRCDAFFARLTERLRGRREGLREGLLEGDPDDEDRGGVDAHLPFLCEELYLLVRAGRAGRRPSPRSPLRAATVASSVKLSRARSRSSRPGAAAPGHHLGPRGDGAPPGG